MKEVEYTAEIDATPDAIFQSLLDEKFLEQLQERLEKVTNVELVSLEEREDGMIRRVTRYTAPADLPRFLRPFKDRAPDEVNWDEVAIIDPAKYRMRFEIIPEVPDHWHDLYESRGLLAATAIDKGRSRVEQRMNYSVDTPALGFLINRAISNEVSNIFKARADVFRKFAGR